MTTDLNKTHTTTVCQTASLCMFIPGCYGVEPASVSKEWKCARCKANAMTEVSEFSRVDLLHLDRHTGHESLWLTTTSYNNKRFCSLLLIWTIALSYVVCRIAVYVH